MREFAKLDELIDYCTPSGFHQAFFMKAVVDSTQIQKMSAVVNEFIDAFMDIGQCGVLLLLFKAREGGGFPALGQLLEGGDIQVAIMKP